MNIADLYFLFRGDDKQLVADATKGGEAAGKAGGAKLSAGLTAGMRLVGSAAGALFGIALKGGQELLQATAAYRAETGATAEEAEAAQKSISRLYQTNTQGFQEIGSALAAVRTNLNLVGEEGEAAADKVLKYAKVSGQDAAGAVLALDDILDAWNLTAEDSGRVLDMLIASHQQYGGVLAEDQAALKNLAPQLQALNLGYEDAIALLNVFKASGLDASKAQFALNSAIQKLPAGTSLEDFVAHLASIEDPAQRAREAIEVFGARGGAGLANAIRPGMTGLADFAISADDAAGSLDEAAEAANSGPWEQLTLALRKLSGPLAEVGTNFGPLLLGFASLGGPKAIATVGAALGALAGKLILRPFVAVGTRIAAVIAAQIAGSTLLGEGLGAALGKLPGAAPVKAGAAKLGTFLGSTLGKASAVAFAAILWVEVINTYNRIKGELAVQTAEIAANAQNQIKNATDAELTIQRDALKTGMDRLAEQARAGNFLALEPLKEIVAQYNATQTELNERAARAAREQQYQLEAAKAGTLVAAQDLVDVLPTALEKGQARARAAAAEWARKPIGEQLVLMGHDARIRGAEAALSLASGLRERRSAVDAAMAQLREDMKNAMSPKKLAARDIGLLFGKDLTKGLNSADPVVKAQAKATRALLEDELIETIKAGGEAGKKIQEELERKLKSKDPDVKAQAQRTKSIIDAALKDQPAKTPGEKIGQDLRNDIAGANGPVGRAAYQLGVTIARQVLAGVRGSGYTSGATSQYARTRTSSGAQQYAEGTPYVPYDQLAYVHRGEIVVDPNTAALVRAGLATIGAPQPPGNVTLIMPDARNRDPFAVLERAARMQRWGLLNTPAAEPAGG